MKIAAALALALALCADASAQPLADAPTSVLVKLTPAAAARVAPGAAARSGLQAFDALGHRVAVVLDGAVPAGTTDLVFDASTLPAGPYLLRVVGETFTKTARVSVAR